MMLFIDSEFRCHTTNPNGTFFREVETDFFDGKCTAFIEGYRYVPVGASWIREDGVAFSGEMITPFVDYNILAAAQKQYEDTLAEMDAAYREGVNSV